jgi:mannose-6-phosphate isomerase-like protein (cupin superfamily)
MLVKKLDGCAEFAAGDGTVLRELLHPEKEAERIRLRFSLARATLGEGRASLRHRLSFAEVYHIIAGEGVMHIDGEARAVVPGDTVYIPPGSVQHIENAGKGDLTFLCIVDPAWRPECEEILSDT